MNTDIEQKLRTAAQNMTYPTTPAIHIRFKQNRQPRFVQKYAWQLILLIVVLLVSLMIWTPVRAAISEWFGLNSLQIVPADQAPTPNRTLIEAMTLSQQTTLDGAQEQVSFILRFPADLGSPDEVYLHEGAPGTGVIMIWRDNDHQIDYALYQFEGAQGIYKGADIIATTRLDEAASMALWLEQPHVFWFQDRLGNNEVHQEAYLIEHPVLIWEYRGILFRFESTLSMEEAIAIANTMTDIK